LFGFLVLKFADFLGLSLEGPGVIAALGQIFGIFLSLILTAGIGVVTIITEIVAFLINSIVTAVSAIANFLGIDISKFTAENIPLTLAPAAGAVPITRPSTGTNLGDVTNQQSPQDRLRDAKRGGPITLRSVLEVDGRQIAEATEEFAESEADLGFSEA